MSMESREEKVKVIEGLKLQSTEVTLTALSLGIEGLECSQIVHQKMLEQNKKGYQSGGVTLKLSAKEFDVLGCYFEVAYRIVTYTMAAQQLVLEDLRGSN